jgi:hypothetical protein
MIKRDSCNTDRNKEQTTEQKKLGRKKDILHEELIKNNGVQWKADLDMAITCTTEKYFIVKY